MPKTTDDIVDSWFNDHFSQGPIARHTEAHNQLFQAIPDLKAKLSASDAPAPQHPTETAEA